jgi:hypothetical protein
MSWLTILKYGLPCLIAAAIAFGSAWEIQGVRIGKLDNKVSELNGEIVKWDAAYKLCEKTNATNNETIGALQGEVKKNNTRCDTQQGIADKTMLALAEIDALPSGVKDKEKYETDNSGVNDSILAALNSMFRQTSAAGSGSAGGEAIRQTADPAAAGAASGLPGTVPYSGPAVRQYCLDSIGAKNLLKNIAQERGRTQRIEALVEGLR